jgi:hypothetical protein
MTKRDERLDLVRSVKEAHESELLDKANVVGVGIGVQEQDGQSTGELAIVVSVTDKLPACALDPDDILPQELDGVPVDVRAVGELAAG